MSQLLQDITDQSFKTDVIDANKPTVVDFWAEWCMPCKAMTPILEDLASKYKDQIQFKKLNIDNNPSSPMQYRVMGIPTLILFKNGQIVDQLVGMGQKSQVEDFLKKAL